MSKLTGHLEEIGVSAHFVEEVIGLERQLAEAQARLRKANCDYGDGWLSGDLECQVDVEPWCGKHAVLHYIKVNKEAQKKLRAIITYGDRFVDWHELCAPNGACGEAEPGGPPCLSPRYGSLFTLRPKEGE